MNILGYITAILILIAITFQSYYSNWFYDQKIRQSYHGHNQANQAIQKEYIDRNFDKIPKQVKPNKLPKTHSTENKEQVFYKKELTPSCMKLNLEPILHHEQSSDHFIYKTLIKLITELYLPKIINEEMLHPFVNEFLSLTAEKVATNSKLYLEQIQFSNEAFQRIYYQMLTHENSLLNYIKVKSKEKICLSCCDDILLTCLFNNEIKNKLTQKKQSPLQRINISKSQLEQSILIHGLDPFIMSFMQCKHSKKSLSEMTITGKDSSTDIVLKQKLSYFNSSKNDG